MKFFLLTAASAALLACQIAPALAQATPDEHQDRSQMLRDDSAVKSDTAHIRRLNSQRRAVELRLKHDRGQARAADEKQLARLNAEEASARKGEADVLANDHATLKDYRTDTTAQRRAGHDSDQHRESGADPH